MHAARRKEVDLAAKVPEIILLRNWMLRFWSGFRVTDFFNEILWLLQSSIRVCATIFSAQLLLPILQ